MRYFAPPAGQNWRLVRAIADPLRYRLDWFPSAARATTWNLAMRSVTAERQSSGTPDAREAIALGVLPPVTDARATVHLSGEHDGGEFLVWEHDGDHACSDMVAVARLRVEGSRILGIACRARPPCSEGDRTDLLFYMLNQVRILDDAPAPDVRELAMDAAASAAFKAQLQGLDAAMARLDEREVGRLLELLAPHAGAAPLSRLAMDMAVAEGWIARRRASPDDVKACAGAIDRLRRALDDMDADVYPEARQRALQWLAETYALRDASGDLDRAIRAYTDVVRLSDDSSPSLGWVALRLGVLESNAAIRHQPASEAGAARAERAATMFAAGRDAFEAAADKAGQVEIAIAEADALRLIGGGDRYARAAQRYGDAWALMTVGGAMKDLDKDRFQNLGRHVWRSMHELDTRQFGVVERDYAGWRASALFLRPLTATRALLVRAPGGAAPVTLEMALSAALAPEVSLIYVGGTPHPAGANWTIATSDSSSWQVAVTTALGMRDLVLMVPGYTPGMQWELRHITEQGKLGRSILIMIPGDADPEASERWAGARAAAVSFGLDLPEYDRRGAFLRFGGDRTVARRLPFDALWQPRALLGAIEDLLDPPDTSGLQP